MFVRDMSIGNHKIMVKILRYLIIGSRVVARMGATTLGVDSAFVELVFKKHVLPLKRLQVESRLQLANRGCEIDAPRSAVT